MKVVSRVFSVKKILYVTLQTIRTIRLVKQPKSKMSNYKNYLNVRITDSEMKVIKKLKDSKSQSTSEVIRSLIKDKK